LNSIALTGELSKALEVLAETGHFVSFVAEEDLDSVVSKGDDAFYIDAMLKKPFSVEVWLWLISMAS